MKAVIAVMPVMPSADAEDRGEDRQAGGDQRAEGQDQDEQRDARCRSARSAPPGSRHRCMPEPLASTVQAGCRGPGPCASVERVDGVAGFDVGDGVDVEAEGDGADPAVLGQRAAAPAAFASACAGGVPLCTAASTHLLRAGRRRPATGLASGASSAICGRRPRSATRSSTAFEYAGSASVWPSGAATTTLTVAWSKASPELGEELGLEVGGLLRRDAGDRERVGHRLGHRRRRRCRRRSCATSQPAMKNGQRR